MFDEFVWRDSKGAVWFAGSGWDKPKDPKVKRHHDRVWPALSRYKRERWRIKAKHQQFRKYTASRFERQNRAMAKASLLTVLRRWYPTHPLDWYHGRICDRAQRPPRYDP
jgi:hypothetical protein